VVEIVIMMGCCRGIDSGLLARRGSGRGNCVGWLGRTGGRW
jgi:hypothetical protein